MYEEYWKLKSRPFKNTPDPGFFYHSVQHDEALMKLSYAVNENMGGAMLTGAYGCGKTLLSRVLVEQIKSTAIPVTCIAQPDMLPLDLLRTLARAISDAEISAQRSDLLADALLEVIEKGLVENRRDGKQSVIIIDEAHMIDNQSALEMTRLLLNFQDADGFMLTLLLIGHPELAKRVTALKQLAQRIPITCDLDHFTREDSMGYIQSRLRVAGLEKDPFTEDALDLVHTNSGGIPRRINTMCDVSLALGAAQQVTNIDANLVKEAVKKFGAN